MNNEAFDAELRRKIQREKFAVDPAVEQKLKQVMNAPRRDDGKKYVRRSRYRYIPMVATLALAAALVVAIIAPPKDTTHGTLPAEGEPATTVKALTSGETLGLHIAENAPSVKVSIRYIGQQVTFAAEIVNDTESTWLLNWNSGLAQAEQNAIPEGGEPERLIWVEAGKTCTDSITWEVERTAPQIINCHWAYTGYRVDNGMLFWIDSQLSPDDPDYQVQQSLLDDAFAAGLLIVQWHSGEADTVSLILPEHFAQSEPETSALAYYLSTGVLDQQSAALCNRAWIEAAERID